MNTLKAAYGVDITVRIHRTITPGKCGSSGQLLTPHQHGIADNSLVTTIPKRSCIGNITIEKVQRELRSHLTVANVGIVPTVGQQYFS